MAQQEVKGISENEANYQGRVAEDPYITEQGAYFHLKTIAPEMGANGAIVDTVQLVPITVIDKGKIKVVADYVKKGKQIKVKTYYKSWEENGKMEHANIVTMIKLGPDEYNPATGGGNQGYQKSGFKSGGNFKPGGNQPQAPPRAPGGYPFPS